MAGHLRTLMHELKSVVITQAHDNNANEAKLDQIRAILRQATSDIAALE